ncbi:MAG: hypothetical protein MK183_13735 [Verrucomicrobiales bacterium]|nr:hypothetical protein [Verrucomicrobiales bacterium]
MWRYHAAGVFIGLLTSILVLGCYESGVFERIAVYLHGLYAGIPILKLPGSPVLCPPLQYGAVIAVAFGVSGLSTDNIKPLFKCLFILLVVSVVAASSIVLAMYGVLFEPVSVCLGTLMAGITGLFLSRTESGYRKRLLLQVAGRRVSRKVKSSLVRRPFGASVRGESREVTVMVFRITNGNELLGEMRARDAIALCNFVLGEVVEFVISRGGYLDEWEPDALRFYFGLPLEDDVHAQSACHCAFDLKTHMEKVRQECAQSRLGDFEHGISLVSGDMATGLYGGGTFTRFSAYGEEIDIAEEICALGTDFGPSVFVAGNSLGALQEEMQLRPVAFVNGDDGRKPIEVHELVNVIKESDDGNAMHRDAFHKGFISFHKGDFVSSLEHFGNAAPASGIDRVLEYYRNLAEEKIERGND